MAKRNVDTEQERLPVDDALEMISGDVDVPLTMRTRLAYPEYGYRSKTKKKACEWKFKKAFSPRVELEIVTGVKADELNIDPGPALRFCFEKDTPGPLVSVGNIKRGTVGEVVEFGNKYLKCLKDEGKGKAAAKACALKTAKGTTHVIAGMPRRSRRSRR